MRVSRSLLLAAGLAIGASPWVPVGAVGAPAGGAAPLRTVSLPPGVGGPHHGLERGVFLIASRQLADPNFEHTVILLVDYDRTGALGLVINRSSGLPLTKVLSGIEGLSGRDDKLYLGGPVARERLFLLVRASRPPPGSTPLTGDVYVTRSAAALRDALGKGSGVSAFRMYAGYAGWAPGQLDAEVARGDWVLAPADPGRIFAPDMRSLWPDLIKRNSGRWVEALPPPGDTVARR